MGMLSDKIAIVTRAASGFGAEISRLYVAEEAKVVVADLNEEGAKTVARSLGSGNAIAVKCDVSKKADIDNLVAAAVKAFGTVDIVVNNAGYTHKNQPMLDTDEAGGAAPCRQASSRGRLSRRASHAGRDADPRRPCARDREYRDGSVIDTVPVTAP